MSIYHFKFAWAVDPQQIDNDAPSTCKPDVLLSPLVKNLPPDLLCSA